MRSSQNTRQQPESNIEQFLLSHNIQYESITPLKQDASFRKYYRLNASKNPMLVLDTSEEICAFDPFLNTSIILENVGIRVPHIYAHNKDLGLMLIEDFGDNRMKEALLSDPSNAMHLYTAAVEILIELNNTHVSPNIPDYSMELLHKELAVFVEWYLKNNVAAELFQKASDEFYAIFDALLSNIKGLNSVMTLRDYHAENLMYIERGELGAIDYQDAVIGHPAYDLVSLLEDARIFVSDEISNNCYKQFVSSLDLDTEEFRYAYDLLGLQRNLKIVGIFHRKNLRDNTPHYLEFLKNTWQYIEHSLENESLATIKLWFEKYGVKRG